MTLEIELYQYLIIIVHMAPPARDGARLFPLAVGHLLAFNQN